MNNKIYIILTIIITLFLCIYYKVNTDIDLRFFMLSQLLQGPFIPSRFWWTITNIFKDKSGAETYKSLISNNKSGFYKTNINGIDTYIVLDMKYIKTILDNSPTIFGAGKSQKLLYDSFMNKNVNVSDATNWQFRRKLNMDVLMTDRVHNLLNNLIKFTNNYINPNPFPLNYSNYKDIARTITSYIIFGDKTEITDDVYNLISDSNKLELLTGNMANICPYARLKLDNLIQSNLNRCTSGHKSLTERATILKYKNREELVHQIPHWIFAITEIISIVVPRLLCLLCNHPDKFAKLTKEIKRVYYDKNIYASAISCKTPYLRYCILETLRLNAPVSTISRTLLEKEYIFKDLNTTFNQGDQFMIFISGILRNETYFDMPNRFVPERWQGKCSEKDYHSLMWSQGPQRCPGKDLSIMIIKVIIIFLMIKLEFNISKLKCHHNLNISNIDVINPFDITFTYFNKIQGTN